MVEASSFTLSLGEPLWLKRFKYFMLVCLLGALVFLPYPSVIKLILLLHWACLVAGIVYLGRRKLKYRYFKCVLNDARQWSCYLGCGDCWEQVIFKPCRSRKVFNIVYVVLEYRLSGKCVRLAIAEGCQARMSWRQFVVLLKVGLKNTV